jgi:hypothetical protein
MRSPAFDVVDTCTMPSDKRNRKDRVEHRWFVRELIDGPSSRKTSVLYTTKGGECGAVDSQQIEFASSSVVETHANEEGPRRSNSIIKPSGSLVSRLQMQILLQLKTTLER